MEVHLPAKLLKRNIFLHATQYIFPLFHSQKHFNYFSWNVPKMYSQQKHLAWKFSPRPCHIQKNYEQYKAKSCNKNFQRLSEPRKLNISAVHCLCVACSYTHHKYVGKGPELCSPPDPKQKPDKKFYLHPYSSVLTEYTFDLLWAKFCSPLHQH